METFKNLSTKYVKYELCCKEEFGDKKLALALFDLLDFKNNIVLYINRAYTNKADAVKLFADKYQFTLIKDFVNKGRYCIFIPKLQSNLQLFELINMMDAQTEWRYFPNVLNFDTLLFNLNNFAKFSAVELNLSKFEAFFDMDFGLHFYFINLYAEKIAAKLKVWEESFENIKFTKKIDN